MIQLKEIVGLPSLQYHLDKKPSIPLVRTMGLTVPALENIWLVTHVAVGKSDFNISILPSFVFLPLFSACVSPQSICTSFANLFVFC